MTWLKGFLCGLGLAVGAGGIVAAPTSRTLLFVDDHDILYRAGTQRVFHPFQRYPGNPVIPGALPWQGMVAWMSVYRDPASGKYQLWYQAYPGGAAKDKTRRSVVAYAESDDGEHFRNPNLGLFDFNGDRNNSIVLLSNPGSHDRYGAAVIVDERAADPARRYKMAYYDFSIADDGVERPGLSVAFSPDGIHWTKYPHAPLIRTYYAGTDQPVPFVGEKGREWAVPLTMSDALDAIYDPHYDRFVIYGKMWINGPDGGLGWKHGMGRIESTDFIHWSPPQLILTPDDEDPSYVEFHTAPVFYYNECYFGMLQILNRAVGGGVIDIELALSRDGFDWKRPMRKEYVLPRGAAGAFDAGSMFPCATPVFLPDEIRFYYGGYSKGATSHSMDSTWKTGIGFATLPRDRFAGVRPVALSDQPTLHQPLKNIGQITLKPMRLGPGTKLTLNADVSKGSARVELLNEAGYRIPGFSREESRVIKGDSLRHEVVWEGHPLSSLPAGMYCIRIHLDNAEAFALTVSK